MKAGDVRHKEGYGKIKLPARFLLSDETVENVEGLTKDSLYMNLSKLRDRRDTCGEANSKRPKRKTVYAEDLLQLDEDEVQEQVKKQFKPITESIEEVKLKELPNEWRENVLPTLTLNALNDDIEGESGSKGGGNDGGIHRKGDKQELSDICEYNYPGTDYRTDEEPVRQSMTQYEKAIYHMRKWGHVIPRETSSNGRIGYKLDTAIAVLQNNWLGTRSATTIDGKYAPVSVVTGKWSDTSKQQASGMVKELLELTRGKYTIKVLKKCLKVKGDRNAMIVINSGQSVEFVEMALNKEFAWNACSETQPVYLLVPEVDSTFYNEKLADTDFGIACWSLKTENGVTIAGFGPTRRAGQLLAAAVNGNSFSEQMDGNITYVFKDQTTGQRSGGENMSKYANYTPYYGHGYGSGERVTADSTLEQLIAQGKNETFTVGGRGRPIEQYVMVCNELHYLRCFITGGEDIDLTKTSAIGVSSEYVGKLGNILVKKHTQINKDGLAYEDVMRLTQEHIYNNMNDRKVIVEINEADIEEINRLCVYSNTDETELVNAYKTYNKGKKKKGKERPRVVLSLKTYCDYLFEHAKNMRRGADSNIEVPTGGKRKVKSKSGKKAEEKEKGATGIMTGTPVKSKEWLFCRILELISSATLGYTRIGGDSNDIGQSDNRSEYSLMEEVEDVD